MQLRSGKAVPLGSTQRDRSREQRAVRLDDFDIFTGEPL